MVGQGSAVLVYKCGRCAKCVRGKEPGTSPGLTQDLTNNELHTRGKQEGHQHRTHYASARPEESRAPISAPGIPPTSNAAVRPRRKLPEYCSENVVKS